MNNQMSKFYPALDSKIECRSDTVWFKKESYIAGKKHSHNKNERKFVNQCFLWYKCNYFILKELTDEYRKNSTRKL